MKRNLIVSLLSSVFACVVLLLIAAGVGAQGQPDGSPQSIAPAGLTGTPISSTFTYQGQLKSSGSAVTDSCDFQFGLWDAASVGLQVGVTQTLSAVNVTNGLFTVPLSSGTNAFNGDARWLTIAVRCPSGSGNYAPLDPRQAITTVPYAVLAGNANQLNGQGSSAFVTVSGPQTISGPKIFTDGVQFADGTTQTTAFYRPTLPGPGEAATVDSAGFVGADTAVAIGADGLGLISYYDQTNGDLKVLHCGNPACNGGNLTTAVDTGGAGGDVGPFTSITIGADGLGLISYYDVTNGHLKVLHCGNSVCSDGNISTTVDAGGAGSNVGRNTSITIGADGLGLISYLDWSNGDLKVLHCGNLTCNSGNTPTTVDSAGIVGWLTSITIGADGLGLISYYDYTNGDLKVLHCGNLACNNGDFSTSVDTGGAGGDVGYFTALTLGADGLGLISYYDGTNGDLKVLHCGNAACTGGNISTTVDTGGAGGNVGYATSITIGMDGLGLISYSDQTNSDLKVLHCGNAACTSGNISTTVDSAGQVGGTTSLTIGADGLGLISYYDNTNGDLKVFRCSNFMCKPFTRVGR